MHQATILEVISAMKHQEDAAYNTVRGLYEGTPVDERSRHLMVVWFGEIADFCKFSPESVAVAVHNMDRYAAQKPHILNDPREFQLVAMTCFYTSVKINEPEAIDPACVSNLSKGVYSIREIEETERDIVATLKWRVNPPTAMSFAESYLKLLPRYSTQVLDVIQAQIRFALADAAFLGSTNSCIAMEAVMNALSLVQPSLRTDPAIQIIQGSLDGRSLSFEIKTKLIGRVQIVGGVQNRPALIQRQSSKSMSTADTSISPRSVTKS